MILEHIARMVEIMETKNIYTTVSPRTSLLTEKSPNVIYTTYRFMSIVYHKKRHDVIYISHMVYHSEINFDTLDA
jgi:hypothetical protein